MSKNNIQFQGFSAEVIYMITRDWSGTIVRTPQYPTREEAIAAVEEEDLFRICRYILNDEECDDLPDEFACDDSSAEGIEEAYNEGQPGVVEFVDAVKEWIADCFTMECPYSPSLDGRVAESIAYVSPKQMAKHQKAKK
jgi:hypothetical protein